LTARRGVPRFFGMNKDQRQGTVENIKGRAKQAAGTLTGNKRTESEGAVDRAKGAARKAVGDVKRAIDRKTDKTPDDE
jgi:uncharacterized protein YjbJ (UPF0337 family)